MNEDTKEIELLFERANKAISPDPTVLRRALTLAAPVTASNPHRYSNQTVEKNYSLIDFIMNWKIVAPAFAVVVLVFVAVLQIGGTKNMNGNLAIETGDANAPMAMMAMETAPTDVAGGGTGDARMMMSKTMAAPATDVNSIDGMVAQIVSEADMDQALFDDASLDSGLVTSDSAALSDYGNSYDVTAF